MRPERTKRLLAAAAILALLAAAPQPPARVVLDAFDGIAGWVAAPSEGVRLTLSSAPGERGGALRLDFDFGGHAGWAAARKEFPRRMPANWAFTLRLKGEAPPETLEFKLVDPTGENVWWSVRRGFDFPRDWKTLRFKKRQVSFAWGPARGGEINDLGAVEITVTAGEGGKGSVVIDELALEELPLEEGPLPAPRAWKSDPVGGERQELVLDLGGRREFGGLALDWDAADFARLYDVETSDDGKAWSKARSISATRGGRAWIPLPESEAAFVRLNLRQSARGKGYALARIAVEPAEFSETPTKFLEAVASETPRGRWPRSLLKQQLYWTLVGVDGGKRSSVGGRRARDGPRRLRGGTLPAVRREAPRLGRGGDLAVPCGRRPPDSLGAAQARRRPVARRDGVCRRAGGRLDDVCPVPREERRLVDRPDDAVPRGPAAPGQSAVAVPEHARRLRADPQRLVGWELGRRQRRAPPRAAHAALGIRGFAVRGWRDRLEDRGGDVSPRLFHLRSGRSCLRGPGVGSRDPGRRRPRRGRPGPARRGRAPSGARRLRTRTPTFEARLDAADRSWREKLDRVSFVLPAAAEPIASTARANLAWILVNRDGPAIQPGTRAYARSWIRDGALTAVALLRLGHADEVREFLRWFAPFQFESGAVPCCVDRRGADPVPENDSHGELLYLAGEYYRFTGDRPTIEAVWPHLAKAAAYIDALRARRRTAEYRSGEKRFFFGLLPESISHEGYSDQPVHSYWDDFWAIRGLSGAAELARALGKSADAARIAASRDEMRQDLHASIRAVIAARGLDYIPGSADLGDLDPTSTTIAFEPCGEGCPPAGARAREHLREVLEHFRRSPSEPRGRPRRDLHALRVARGGQPRAPGPPRPGAGALRVLLRRPAPAGWNHWAEVVWPDLRAPKFIGDMPHGWVGSDFIRSFLDLFAYDREEDGALVLGAGIPASWLADPRGASVSRLRTRSGTLDLAFTAEGVALRVRIGGGAVPPPGGFVVTWPFAGRPSSATINGRPAPISAAGEVIVRTAPADVIVK